MEASSSNHEAPHATEWRLTWWSCDVTGELPSKKFMSCVAVSNQSHRAA
jgi:hypothetical protein